MFLSIVFHCLFTHLCCLSADHQDRNPSAGSPGRRPRRRGWGRPGCPWWPAYRPSVQSSRPGSTSLSAPRTCPGSPQRPIRQGRSCNRAPGTLLQQDKGEHRRRVKVRSCVIGVWIQRKDDVSDEDKERWKKRFQRPSRKRWEAELRKRQN